MGHDRRALAVGLNGVNFTKLVKKHRQDAASCINGGYRCEVHFFTCDKLRVNARGGRVGGRDDRALNPQCLSHHEYEKNQKSCNF